MRRSRPVKGPGMNKRAERKKQLQPCKRPTVSGLTEDVWSKWSDCGPKRGTVEHTGYTGSYPSTRLNPKKRIGTKTTSGGVEKQNGH